VPPGSRLAEVPRGEGPRRWLCLPFLVAAGLAVAGFALQNHHDVTLTFYDRAVSAPLAGVLAAAYGWGVVGLFRRSFEAADFRQREHAEAR